MNLPKRKYPRASFLDYNEGIFFVTICTADKRHYFGFIRNDEMHLSAIGEYLDAKIGEIPLHFPDAAILNYVIMPNHVHLILEITVAQSDTTDTSISSDNIGKNYGKLNKLKSNILVDGYDPALITHFNSRLSVVIGGMKAAVSRFANRSKMKFGWQSRYHDHLIRGNRDGDRIWNYVDNNVSNWDKDCFNKM